MDKNKYAKLTLHGGESVTKHYQKAKRHPLMKNSEAPRNRTIFLAEEDLVNMTAIPSVDELTPDSFINRIFCGDCIKGLAKIPKGSVDMVFADPPYFNKRKDYGYALEGWKDIEEYLAWNDVWIKEAVGVLKETGSIYICCDWEYSGKIQEILSAHAIVKNRITWRREKGRGANRNWKNNMEDIWFAVKDEGKYIFNLEAVKFKKEILAPYTDEKGKPKDWVKTAEGEKYRLTCPPNIWMDLAVPFWSMPENTPHPTQKPEKLVERCILASVNPGGVILDPFMGSGTTAVASLKNGYSYVGFEMNKEYIMLARKRLEKAGNID